MGPDGLGADAEVDGDLLVGAAVDQAAQDLTLAPRQVDPLRPPHRLGAGIARNVRRRLGHLRVEPPALDPRRQTSLRRSRIPRVGTARGHRRLQDAGRTVDLPAREAPVVAAAIEPLEGAGREFRLLGQLRRARRGAPRPVGHGRQNLAVRLAGRRRAGEQPDGHARAAQAVQVARPPQTVRPRIGEAEMPGRRPREGRDPRRPADLRGELQLDIVAQKAGAAVEVGAHRPLRDRQRALRPRVERGAVPRGGRSGSAPGRAGRPMRPPGGRARRPTLARGTRHRDRRPARRSGHADRSPRRACPRAGPTRLKPRRSRAPRCRRAGRDRAGRRDGPRSRDA